MYAHLHRSEGLEIAEVGGGNSRLLGPLSSHNRCWNIDRFEGLGNGPTTASAIPEVSVLDAYLGDFDPALPAEFFDVVFSISVVEHVDTDRLDLFHQDLLRILRPGGRFIHAIDMYLADQPTPYMHDRYSRYRGWLGEYDAVEPLGDVLGGELSFSCDMASNPDNVLFGWGASVPQLRPLREVAQSVSLLVAGRKRSP